MRGPVEVDAISFSPRYLLLLRSAHSSPYFNTSRILQIRNASIYSTGEEHTAERYWYTYFEVDPADSRLLLTELPRSGPSQEVKWLELDMNSG